LSIYAEIPSLICFFASYKAGNVSLIPNGFSNINTISSPPKFLYILFSLTFCKISNYFSSLIYYQDKVYITPIQNMRQQKSQNLGNSACLLEAMDFCLE